MLVQINGKQKEISTGMTIKELLDQLQLDPVSVVVELNRTILRADDLTEQTIQGGDSLELIRFVGGG